MTNFYCSLCQRYDRCVNCAPLDNRYASDELHDFAQDFDLAVPEQDVAEDERDTPTGGPHNLALRAAGKGETATSAPLGRHDFKASPNPRNDGCASCGRSAGNPIHESPALREAAATASLERALKSLREGNRHYAMQETAFALRVLRGER